MEILIAGGGYVGMYAARRLERLLRPREATVTVVDPCGYMTYQPFLAEAAGGSDEPRHVIAPLPRVLRHTRLLTGKIVSIDHGSRRAVSAPARGRQRVLRYDVLVLAAGSVARVLPVEGLADYGAEFKTVSEAVHLRNHVLSQLAVAASAGHAASGAAALTFVVVGGGFAGVEALAELQGLADQAVRFHPALDRNGLRWVLVEATGRILPELDERLGQWTLRALRRRGVDVRPHTRLASAARDTVVLDDGTKMAAGTLVWAAGVRPSPLAAAAGLPTDKAGRSTCIGVREEFQVGYDLLGFRPVAPDAETGVIVAHYARVDGTGGFVVHDVPGQPYPHISRSSCAPACYQGLPANLWIKIMERHRRRTADGHLARALTGDWERALSAYGGRLADARVETVCVTPTP